MKTNTSSLAGPRSWPLVGHLPFLVFSVLKARGNFAEAVRQMLSEYGRGTLYLQVGGRPVVISADPRFARLVLVEHASDFLKTGWEKRVLTPSMKDGLIILEAGGRVTDLWGAPWRLEEPSIVASNGLVHDAILAALRDARRPDRAAQSRSSAPAARPG